MALKGKCLYGPDHEPCRAKCISGNLANRLTRGRFKFKSVRACLNHFKEEMRAVYGGR